MTDLELAEKFCKKAQSSKNRGIEFSLTLKRYRQLLSSQTCYYTGVTFDETNSEFKRTLERLDPRVGYTDSNTVAVCHAANVVKSAFDVHAHKGTFSKKQNVRFLQMLLKNHAV